MPKIYQLTSGDKEIIERSIEEGNPSILTDYYIKPAAGGYLVMPGTIRHNQYMKIWERQGREGTLVGRSNGISFSVEPRMADNLFCFFERRGYMFLPWVVDFDRAPQSERTIIGLTGSGKTEGIGMLSAAKCAVIPWFKFLNVAPTKFQSDLMFDGIRQRIEGTQFRDRFVKPGKSGIVSKPYPKINYVNGSEQLFLNLADGAENIQTYSGDWINMDEAGQINGLSVSGQPELTAALIGISTRLRGERNDGRPRLARLSLISFAYDCDPLWERYEYGLTEEGKKFYYSRLVKHKENPYLTPAYIEQIKRNIPPGEEARWLEGERPIRQGREFSEYMLDNMYSSGQMSNMEEKFAAKVPGYRIEKTFGVVQYEEPYEPMHVYVMSGDPGLGEPPGRNAPCIIVFDVTDFPRNKARMVAFWWGYSQGSYMPFIGKFEEFSDKYKIAPDYRGYDSTAGQKAIAELAWNSGEMQVVPLSFDSGKKAMYLNCLKLLLSKALFQIPDRIVGISSQMKNYELPDKKIAQDIVATLCMCAFLMFPLYLQEYPDEENAGDVTSGNREMLARSSRDFRSNHTRNGRSRGRR